MYLHEDKETFKEIIEQVSDDTGRTAIVIEKDYYVTMILRLLSQKLSNVVFKGGTSLSKGLLRQLTVFLRILILHLMNILRST